MFDIAHRSLIAIYTLTIQVVLEDVFKFFRSLPLQYTNGHNAIDTGLGRMMYPPIFFAIMMWFLLRQVAQLVVQIIFLFAALFTHFIPLTFFPMFAAKWLPWISYSNCLEGEYAKDVDFLREHHFKEYHIEMFNMFGGWCAIGLFSFFLLKTEIDNDELGNPIYGYVIYRCEAELNQHLMKIQRDVDKQKDIA